MDTIKINKSKTKVIAHRGASGLETENTMAAFVAAGNRSYYGIETDVHVTGDGEFIIIHDSETGRMAAANMSVEGSTFAQLRSLPLRDKDGRLDRIDLRMPSLEEYIRLCVKYRKSCILELKNQFSVEKIEEMISRISALGAIDSTVFISFCAENLMLVRDVLPNQSAQLLSETLDENTLRFLCENKLDLDVYYPALTREWIDTLHSHNITVNCWTVDDPVVAEKLIEWGVDQITSNKLE